MMIDNESGLLVDPEDVEVISQTITHLLTDEAYARRLG